MGQPRPGPVTMGIRLPQRGPRMSLFQVREPAFWALVGLLLAAGVLTLAQQGLLFASSPFGFALSWVLLLFYMLPMFLVIYYLDWYDREPLSLVFAALVWGAVGATALAGLGNEGWISVVARLGGPDFAATWSAALTAPFVEEGLKAIGVVLIYLIARREVNDVMDGFVYGAMIGLGFTVVEDVYYFVGQFGGNPGGVLVGFFVRVIASGLYGHVLYSGLTGIGIAYFVTRKGEVGDGRRWLVAGGLFATAVLAHFLWNSPLLDLFPGPGASLGEFLVRIPLATAVKGLPFLAFLVLMLRMAHGRELYWLRKSIEGELGGPGLQPGELPILLSARNRREARKAAARQGGPAAASLLKRLQREQIKLAMVRTKAPSPDDPDVQRQRGVCHQLRLALSAALRIRS